MSIRQSREAKPIKFRSLRLTWRGILVGGAAFAAASFAAGPALAHHVMDGEIPRTALQGLVSGLAHPVIGLDHLAFILGLGLLAGIADRALLLPLAFIGGALAGAMLHLGGANIPYVEAAIGLSVLVIALAVFLRLTGPAALFAALLVLAGTLHGYAYAESIIGAEPAPLYAYLAGFSVIQYIIAAGTALLAERLVAGPASGGVSATRLAALVIAFIGVLPLAGLA